MDRGSYGNKYCGGKQVAKVACKALHDKHILLRLHKSALAHAHPRIYRTQLSKCTLSGVRKVLAAGLKSAGSKDALL